MNPLRLLLADDHTIVRQGLVSMLEDTGECRVVAEAADGYEALALAAQTLPDIVITDLSMPRLSGLEVVKRLRQTQPATPALVLTVHEEDEYILPVLRAGAQGFLNKDTTVAELRTALQAIRHGRPYLGARASRALAARQRPATGGDDGPLASLTPREREVFHLIVQAKTTKEIARTLDIGVKTAENHRLRMMDKLGLHSAAEVLRFAARRGLLA